MSFKRRKIIKKLNELEKQYLISKREVKPHQKYVSRIYNQHRVLILSVLGSLTVWILYANRSRMNVKQVKRYTGYLFMTIFTSIQAKLITLLMNKSMEKIKK